MADRERVGADSPRATVALSGERYVTVVDPFAGPGGWSEGLRMVGLRDVGIELDAAACATRAAAGHLTIRADLRHFTADRFARRFEGVVISPPCQDFSSAGKRAGRSGDKGELIDLAPAWILTVEPEWFACEQTPLALPIWQEHAHLYRQAGYTTWCGILDAADYGVPQNRKRAILMGARWPFDPPKPTHAKRPHPDLFGTTPLPHVTMAEALGWGLSDRPAFTFCGSNEGGMDLAGGSGARQAIKRARAEGRWVVDRRTNSKAAGWKHGAPMVPTVTVPVSRPSPTLTGKAMGQWLIHPEGEPDESIKLTLRDALTIQSFRPDYPVQPVRGNTSKQGEQVGNAVPPLLAAHVVSALTGAHIAQEAAA